MKKIARLTIIFLAVFAAAPDAKILLSEEAIAPLPLQNFSVPEEIGKVQERFAGSGRVIIQIQDVHAHGPAQENIAAILERLRTAFGVTTAALEGAWATTSLPKSHALPTSREKQTLARTLMEEDLITGPAYAAIMSPQPITLVGIEDAELYQKNRELFLAHLGKAQTVSEKLDAYGQSILVTEQAAWNPELLSFGTAFGKFRETNDLGQFFPFIVKTAGAQGVDFSDLAQLTLLQEITSLERTVVKEKLHQQIAQLMREYKGAPWTVEELIRGEKVSPEKLGMYPQIVVIKKLLDLKDKISLKDLTEQIGTLTSRLLGKLVTTPEQDALWRKAERFHLAKKVLLLQATPRDLEALEKERAAVGSELASAGLSEELALAVNFYDAVKQRDQVFFDKIMSDPALSGNIAVVTGGFHTDGLSELFRKAGVSYVTVSPELGGQPMNEKLYKERMADDEWRTAKEPQKTINAERVAGSEKQPVPSALRHPSSESETLSELRNRIESIDDNFPPALEALRQTNRLPDAVAVFLGKEITVSARDKRRVLAADGRLKPSRTPDTVDASVLQVSEFMALPRAEQRSKVQSWMEQANGVTVKPMLVTSAGILAELMKDPRNAKIVEANRAGGDTFALLQDIPVGDTPESLLTGRGVARFEVRDMDALITGTARFQKLAKLHPFVVMKEDYRSEKFVVLPEDPLSLWLYRIIASSSSLYRAAKNPEFLTLLQSLVTEIISSEAVGRAV